MVDNPQQNYWSKLKDSTDSMSDAQKGYVMNSEEVKKKYKDMMKSFSSFLFEKYKEDFAAVPAFQPVIDEYIATVLNTAQDYGKHTADLEEENRKLKEMLDAYRLKTE